MSKTLSLDILDQIKIASPCSKRWDDMPGTDRKRFCDDCRLNVYNLSAMSREEAVELVSKSEGRLCAYFWRRPDGTILTQNCPVGLAAIRAKAASAMRRLAAAAVLIVGGGVVLGSQRTGAWRLREAQPFATVYKWLDLPGAARRMPTVTGGIVDLQVVLKQAAQAQSGSSGGAR